VAIIDLMNKKFQKEIISGTSALVPLSVLDQSGKPMYCYQIAKIVSVGSEDMPKIKLGTNSPRFLL
jgi:hypothetical protein